MCVDLCGYVNNSTTSMHTNTYMCGCLQAAKLVVCDSQYNSEHHYHVAIVIIIIVIIISTTKNLRAETDTGKLKNPPKD